MAPTASHLPSRVAYLLHITRHSSKAIQRGVEMRAAVKHVPARLVCSAVTVPHACTDCTVNEPSRWSLEQKVAQIQRAIDLRTCQYLTAAMRHTMAASTTCPIPCNSHCGC